MFLVEKRRQVIDLHFGAGRTVAARTVGAGETVGAREVAVWTPFLRRAVAAEIQAGRADGFMAGAAERKMILSHE